MRDIQAKRRSFESNLLVGELNSYLIEGSQRDFIIHLTGHFTLEKQ